MSRYKGALKVVAVAQQKGGVGKTTVCRNLADYFARFRESRVLVIDYDPQGNLSFRYLKMEKPNNSPKSVMPPVHPTFDPFEDYEDGWNGRSSSADIFNGSEVVPYDTENPLIQILPCYSYSLRQVEKDRPDELNKKVINALKYFLSLDAVIENYDIVLIDTAPSRQALAQTSLRAATHIIVPLIPEKQNIETLSDMVDFWREENSTREPDDSLEMIGFVPNLVGHNSLHRGLIQSLHNDPGFTDLVTPFTLGDRIAVAEADHEASKHKSVFDLRPKDKARMEMLTLCQYVENALYGEVSEV